MRTEISVATSAIAIQIAAIGQSDSVIPGFSHFLTFSSLNNKKPLPRSALVEVISCLQRLRSLFTRLPRRTPSPSCGNYRNDMVLTLTEGDCCFHTFSVTRFSTQVRHGFLTCAYRRSAELHGCQ